MRGGDGQKHIGRQATQKLQLSLAKPGDLGEALRAGQDREQTEKRRAYSRIKGIDELLDHVL